MIQEALCWMEELTKLKIRQDTKEEAFTEELIETWFLFACFVFCLSLYF